MRHLAPLVRKELRDLRWVLLGSAASPIVLGLAAAAWAATKSAGATEQYASTFVIVSVAIAAGLGSLAAAAEMFGGEAASRRIEATALLPVPLSKVFAAKVATLLIVVAGLSAWGLGSTSVATLLLWGDNAAIGFGRTSGFTVANCALLALATSATVALLAVVLEHGLGAVLGAVGVMAYLVWEAKRGAMTWLEWGILSNSTVVVALSAVSAAMLAAAGLAFVRGPIHLSRRVLRASLGAGLAVTLLGGGGLATAAVLDARVDVVPGDANAGIGEVHVSPDGRHAVLLVWNERNAVTSHAWVVRLSDGVTHVLPGRYRTFRGWREPGQVLLPRGTSPQEDLSDRPVDVVDLETGRTVSVRSAEQLDAEPWTEGWAEFQKVPDGFVARWRERGIERQFVGGVTRLQASPTPGRLLMSREQHAYVVDLDSDRAMLAAHLGTRAYERWLDGGRRLRYFAENGLLMELDCETGQEKEIAPPRGVWPRMASQGPYALYRVPGYRTGVALVREGRVVREGSDVLTFVPGSTHHVLVNRGTLVDLETGHETLLGPVEWKRIEYASIVHRLPDGTFLLARAGGGLDVIDGAGGVVRALLKPAR